MTNFESLGVSKQIVATLSELGIETPTPIQSQAIPRLLEGRDLIGLAQTGTGKTAAFGLPLIERLMAEDIRPDNRTTRSLILAPTRELVNQIAANLKSYIKKSPLRINLVVGGVSINKQQQQLERGTDILVATPGRLLDLINRRALSLTTVRFLILDEADQMLDLGFVHDLRKIAKMVPKRRQTMLFSATMPKAIADLAAEFLVDPVKVEVTPAGKAADKIDQFVHFVAGKNDKTVLLKETLKANPDGRAIVFLRTKHTAEKLAKHLEQVDFKVASIHGNKSQGQRERALKAFRDGEISVLVATDVAARGIDIPAVSHVYNYDLPEVPDAYIHRIGRTARAGREGIAIAFCAPDEAGLLRDIEKMMGIEIQTASGERPEGMGRPARGGNNNRGANGNRGRAGNGQARGGEGRGERAGGEGRPERRARPARKPFFADGEASERGSEQRERPARQAQGEQRPARTEHRKGARPGDFKGLPAAGNAAAGAPAARSAPRPAAPQTASKPRQPAAEQVRQGEARGRAKTGGPVRFGGNGNDNRTDQRGGGLQGRKRSGA
ncbi:DEAD/DEAH box helicase [Neorhizobium lilium]|uniref:DEAD/DEAH box helicase n=1 Tax=Neorhizobium lilium TaxID=2503024 RepID=UPI001FE0F8FD|nr:DEAD/DEAH box helicase [Neorhizobium lilium]